MQAIINEKPRGIEWVKLDTNSTLRYSFCYREDGCRKRVSPLSLRFAGRKVYYKNRFIRHWISLEQAIKVLIKNGMMSGEIGILELEYREVLRGIMSHLDRL